MYFHVGEHQVHFHFGREFCLISGLRFGHRDIIKDTDVRPLWEINREWWGQLLGMTDAGWFDNSHINAWVLTLMEDRLEDAPWTIQSPEFFNYLTGKSGILGGAREADETTKPFLVWWSIRHVLIPINIIDRHWVLGELDLDSMVFAIYDTYNIKDYSEILKDKIKTFRMLLKDFLCALNDVERAKNYKKFHAQFDTNIPSKRGIWVIVGYESTSLCNNVSMVSVRTVEETWWRVQRSFEMIWQRYFIRWQR